MPQRMDKLNNWLSRV